MKNRFAVKQNGEIKTFEVTRKKVNIPGFPVMTAEQFVTNAEAVSYVMRHPVHQVILKEVAAEEVKDPEPAPVVEEVKAPEPAKPKVVKKKATPKPKN